MAPRNWSRRLQALGISPRGDPMPLSGGDIAAVWALDTDRGRVVVKRDDASRLAGEAEGLRALQAAASSLIVPEVLGIDDDLLVMQALEPVSGGRQADRKLGEGLRQLHEARGETHGWEVDNACGPTPQDNTPCDDGRVFQRERRLLPLGRACAEKGLLDTATLEALTRVAEELETWLPNVRPSLVHGDLWSGNVLHTARGPAIIDPAVYRHYPEVDLAMLTLFGSPSAAFFEAYWDGDSPEDWPRRRTLFQLYPLLNHLLLFGGGYRGAVERAIDDLR
ncbi:Fructosamine-3-kinase [Modicisalibacter ilicicola DSM 19980]|uniref:Fructosamine-3-kinase n=1 Tax=Modicisalibacter ilicicola DSM 19980 TaxID=1121942 RepID=A0A1M4T3S8_9GAMM|nr:fructosamine kinase family protein [Halomonas ilicicola]SHE39182.1 Fructosamine-3-kinase [Halomonas ilicicola DSM 19980]